MIEQVLVVINIIINFSNYLISYNKINEVDITDHNSLCYNVNDNDNNNNYYCFLVQESQLQAEPAPQQRLVEETAVDLTRSNKVQ